MDFLRFLEGIRLPYLDSFFQWCTYLGQELPILIVICVLFWCVHKDLAYQIGLSFFCAGLLLQSLKITFRIDRPWILDPDFHPVASALPAATGYSFPSGHTQSATSLFSVLGLHAKKRWLKVICVMLFCLVGFSRMYLGVHTPKDVLAAIAVGLICSLLIHRFYNRRDGSKKENFRISLALGILSLAVICYTLLLMRLGKLDAVYAKDCCSASGAGLGFALGWYLERTYLDFSPKGSLPFQILKCIVGLLGALALKEGLSLLLGEGIFACVLQYFLLVLWVLVLFPFLFQTYQSRKF